MRSMISLLRQAGRDFLQDDCPRMAAAISYYTIFSLPPLLLLILLITGVVVDQTTTRARIGTEMASLIGPGAAAQVQEMIEIATRTENRGPGATLLWVAALLLGATGVFGQLQSALNRAWEVAPDPEQGGVKRMLGKRLLSLGMVMTIAFLLLVSLLLSAAMSAFGESLGAIVPGGVAPAFLHVLQLVLSLGMTTLLFALLFKLVPDAQTSWRDVAVGAVVTGVLFVAGKFLLGLYLSKSDPGEAFGAAGSLAVILVWVYYSAMIVFLGAEFTQVWAKERGAGIAPRTGALRMVEGVGREL